MCARDKNKSAEMAAKRITSAVLPVSSSSLSVALPAILSPLRTEPCIAHTLRLFLSHKVSLCALETLGCAHSLTLPRALVSVSLLRGYPSLVFFLQDLDSVSVGLSHSSLCLCVSAYLSLCLYVATLLCLCASVCLCLRLLCALFLHLTLSFADWVARWIYFWPFSLFSLQS